MMIDKHVTVGSIMTRDVYFVRPGDSMMKVDEVFRRNNLHHVPVIDEDKKVVGIISKSDYYKVLDTFTRFDQQKTEELNRALLESFAVEQVMTKQVATLHPEEDLMVAASIFQENLFHAMPVVDGEGKLLGILSTYDLIKYAYTDRRLIEEE